LAVFGDGSAIAGGPELRGVMLDAGARLLRIVPMTALRPE
jgi:hypothetical protein